MIASPLSPGMRALLLGSRRYSAAVLQDGPVGYWRLGETLAGATVVDASGNGRHGSYVGGVTLGQNGALAGDPDAAALFNGSTGYGTVPDAASLDYPGSGGWTLEAWVKVSTAKTQGVVSKQGGAGQRSYGLYLDSGNHVFLRVSSNGTAITDLSSTSVFSSNTWAHVAGTYDGAFLYVYINGASAVTPQAYSSGIFASTMAVEIGALATASFFNGTLDEVAIYPAALSAARIAAHYKAGIGA